eukprot:3648121-Rhodomonas_salina.1
MFSAEQLSVYTGTATATAVQRVCSYAYFLSVCICIKNHARNNFVGRLRVLLHRSRLVTEQLFGHTGSLSGLKIHISLSPPSAFCTPPTPPINPA